MAYKFIAFIAFAALASGALLPAADLQQRDEEYDPHPSYSFSYEVKDDLTGDVKSQSETRDGSLVQGQYALQDADGYQRIVQYSVNGESGFHAAVRREPLSNAAVRTASAPAPISIPSQAESLVQEAPAKDPNSKPVVASHALPTLKPFKLQAAYVQPATFLRAAYTAPTVVHHAPAHTVIHSPSTVHLAPAATHFVHAAPATTLLKAAPAVIAHHAPTVVRTSLTTPHFQYVY